MNLNDMLTRVARGGPNSRGRRRGSNRPRGEGAGLIPTVSAIFGRGKRKSRGRGRRRR
jgi:hypothetical protein